MKFSRQASGHNSQKSSGQEGPGPGMLLVVPPFIRPTSPPLAPASLQAFLKQELPGSHIRCLDLNLRYFYVAMEWLLKGTIKLRLYNWGHAETAEKVNKAFHYLGTTVPAHENVGEYHMQATIFLSFEAIFNTFISEMALRSLAGAPVPPGISAFFNEIYSEALSTSADIVGISVLFDIQMPMALLLAERLKETRNVRVFLGGAKFGVEPGHDRLLHDPVTVKAKGRRYEFQAGKFIDGIISGEGELALLHVMKHPDLANKEEIPNLTYLKEGMTVFNPPAVLEDLDRLPCPDFSDFALEQYMCPEKILPLLTARGCPWGRCTFCTHHRSYKKYRQRSLDKVIEDIKVLSDRYDVRLFNLFDEMIPPGRFKRLAAGILEEGLNICYSAYGKPVRAFDRKTLELIHDSGCRLMLWGLESASQRVLDVMNKGTEIDDVRRVITMAAQAGIKNLVFVMFGFPGESEEEFLATLSFLERNREAIHALSKGTFRLMEGSPIAEKPGKFGISEIREKEAPAFKSRLLTYKMSASLQPEEAEALFKKNLKKIESVGITPRFGAYREHLLVYGCREG